jgi:hypothetical protein
LVVIPKDVGKGFSDLFDNHSTADLTQGSGPTLEMNIYHQRSGMNNTQKTGDIK